MKFFSLLLYPCFLSLFFCQITAVISFFFQIKSSYNFVIDTSSLVVIGRNTYNHHKWVVLQNQATFCHPCNCSVIWLRLRLTNLLHVELQLLQEYCNHVSQLKLKKYANKKWQAIRILQKAPKNWISIHWPLSNSFVKIDKKLPFRFPWKTWFC